MQCLVFGSDARTVLDVWTMLAASGHSVCATAREPAQCLEKAAATRPDLVIVDLGTGDDRTRLEVAGRLQGQGIPAVAVTEEGCDVPPGTLVRAVMRKPLHKEYMSLVLAKVDEACRAARRGSD